MCAKQSSEPDRAATPESPPPAIVRIGHSTDGQVFYQPKRDEFDMCRRPLSLPADAEEIAAWQQAQERLAAKEEKRKARRAVTAPKLTAEEFAQQQREALAVEAAAGAPPKSI